MRGLLVAVGFLTRIPVPVRVFADARAQSASLAWYPAVGLLLGALLSALAWLLADAPPLLAAALVLLAWIGLTGALHLDGLADSADAWVGGLGDRERTLSIMKDPRCGPAGVVALVAVLLLKFAALASLPRDAWLLLLVPPLLGRTALTAAFVCTPYVRAAGLGSMLVSASRVRGLGAITVAVLGVAFAFGVAGVIAGATAITLFALWRRGCMRRIGGFTGDTAGALAEVTEAAVLVALVFTA
ncbi:MAG: Cobalamin synthase [uncultured Lysobacter sp.]|uniref:Adenosylcobinamide-GDP ribazoletransferase n=1 Tax=uncultured Lysobacter sp. TaxID=271060 RepID=A0A6J4KB39_9GAMM|nr:MAG: Cobalamin synthase [uncultured Lysobacter sp.]